MSRKVAKILRGLTLKWYSQGKLRDGEFVTRLANGKLQVFKEENGVWKPVYPDQEKEEKGGGGVGNEENEEDEEEHKESKLERKTRLKNIEEKREELLKQDLNRINKKIQNGTAKQKDYEKLKDISDKLMKSHLKQEHLKHEIRNTKILDQAKELKKVLNGTFSRYIDNQDKFKFVKKLIKGKNILVKNFEKNFKEKLFHKEKLMSWIEERIKKVGNKWGYTDKEITHFMKYVKAPKKQLTKDVLNNMVRFGKHVAKLGFDDPEAELASDDMIDLLVDLLLV